jgi:methylase of polypeptide subunit release factors
MISEYIEHARNFEYMSGIERDTLRTKQTAEVFTPTSEVQRVLDNIEEKKPNAFQDPTETFLDNCCGDGQILSEVVIRKMERSGCSLEQALSTIYGVDIMSDNIELCRKRLMGPNPTESIIKILNNNIVCADALEYDYSFGQPVGIEIFS